MTKQQRAIGLAGMAALAAAAAVVLVRRARARRALHRTPQRALTRRPGPVTPSLVAVNAADMWLGEPGRNQELRLEEALRETFPASDAIATMIE